MTTIAWDGCTLAADKQITDYGNKRTTTKIFRINHGQYCGYLMGAAGNAFSVQDVLEWLNLGGVKEKYPESQKNKENNADILLISPRGELSILTESATPIKFEDSFIAIGSGTKYAMGAMAQGASARDAVQIASRFDDGTGMGIDILHLVKPK